MPMNKLTIKAQEALQSAVAFAQENGQQNLELEHLFLAPLTQSEGITRSVLERLGVSTELLKKGLEAIISKYPRVQRRQ